MVFTPIATNRAFRLAASYRSRGGLAKAGYGNAGGKTRGDQTYIAGCAFRSLACAVQVLFALNRLYLINEKGALAAAARLPLTVNKLAERVTSVWQAIGLRAFDDALAELRSIGHALAGVTEAAL
jgi:hypothetical protein